MLECGDHAPWFEAAALSGSPNYQFDTVAGRHVLILFHGSAAAPASAAALGLIAAHRSIFDDRLACFFAVTNDPEDAESGRIAQQLPGIRHFLDYDRKVSIAYRALSADGALRPHWLLLDPALRVVDRFEIDEGEAALASLASRVAGPPSCDHAPILQLPDLLEPNLCRRLIAYYEAQGGEESGFMRDVGGKTVRLLDPAHKQRRDCRIIDAGLRALILQRVRKRALPALERAFQFRATRLERYLVACYEAGHGHFRPHRDNTTRGTAHRRFAMTVNLNADDYEGGDLRFPEYGMRTYRAATGGAVIFSCSLLHEATPVTKGRRLCFLPFLYDDAAARQREANNRYLGDEVGEYRMQSGPARSA